MASSSLDSLSPAAQAALNDHFVRAVELLDVERVNHLLAKGLDASLVRVLPATKPGDEPTAMTLMDLAWWAALTRARSTDTEVDTERCDAVVQALVEHGGDPNACAWHVWLNSPSLYLTFIRAGVELNGEESMTYHHPLRWWYQQHQRPIEPAILEAMIEHGMNVHHRVDGHPLLAHCLGANDLVAADRLIRAGAHAQDFTLPIHSIAGQHLLKDGPEKAAGIQATLAWWVANEQTVLRQALHRPDETPAVAHPARARL